jgi:effector-binding domain-containing protein
MPQYHVARSVDIAASPSQTYDVVADYATWTTWSPWLLADPDAKVEISQPSAAIGSRYAWHGELTGQGELHHRRLEPGRLVEDELQFLKPFKSTCTTSFELEPSPVGTRLTWHMHGSMPWFLFWMLPSLKTYIGMDYQRGLAMLKDWIETGQIPSRCDAPGRASVGPLRMAGIRGTCSVAEIGPALERALADSHAEFDRLGLPATGAPMVVYSRFRAKQGVFEFLAGSPIDASAIVSDGGRLQTWTLPSVQALHVRHTGSYRHLGNAWSVAHQTVRHRKLKPHSCGAFEIYRNDPAMTAENALVTDVYVPLK